MISRWLLFLIVVSLVGCQDDAIKSYKVPKAAKSAAPAVAEGKSIEARTLGAIIPDGDASWFFKLQGAKTLVDEQAEAFDKLIRTVRLTNKADAPIEWTLPDGWKQEPASGIRYATLRPKDSSLAVSVSRFGGSLVDNVNRWRGEVGMKPVTEAELEQTTKRLDLNGVKGTIVDVSGPLAPKRGPMGMGR